MHGFSDLGVGTYLAALLKRVSDADQAFLSGGVFGHALRTFDAGAAQADPNGGNAQGAEFAKSRVMVALLYLHGP